MIEFNDYKNCLINGEVVLNHNKDLKVKDTMCTQKILTRLR